MLKHVVITGAANGLGWALAQQYWQQGYHLHLLDINQEKLATRKTQLQERISTYAVDLLNDQQLMAFCQDLIRQKIVISRLINNAGITHRSKASLTDFEVFDRVMKLNWRVPVHLTRHLLPLLEQYNSKIICIGSMAALMPVPGRAAYCASKSALVQHFETWRPELLKENIDLLMVFPSFVQTNIEQNAVGEKGGIASHPQSRIGNVMSAEHMAKAIVEADSRKQQRLYSPQIISRIGFWLWVLLPKLFQRMTWRQFAGEIN